MTITAIKNPIISGRGVCDPHVHIFGDCAYLYASHDVPDGDGMFTMHDWEIWKSPDLVNWTRTSVVRPETFGMGKSDNCWAVDAAEKDGKYYLYVSNGTKETWVLTSDDPGDGFTEPLGRPILPEGLTPTRSYDPAVFTDDDGQSYIVFGTPVWAGGDSYYIARLNDDMVSLSEAPRKIELDDSADDKPFIHKHGGIYYLTWASFWATSDSVYGPYTTRGNLGLSADHGSFFTWRGQWFKAFTVDETIGKMRRATGLSYIHFTADGSMRADPLIREYGVGQYDARWNRIMACWYMAGEGVSKRENVFSGFDVSMEAGSSLYFPNIHDLPEDPYITLFGVSPRAVDVDVYEGDRLLATVHKPASFMNGGTFSRYSVASARLPLSAGTHSLRLVSRGELLLEHIRFMAG